MGAAPVDGPDAEGLRNLADQIRDRLGSGIVLLGAVTGDKLGFVACVTRDLVELGYNAGAIAREAARAAGGGGGGRPDMAQAGGRDVSKLDAALAAAYRPKTRYNVRLAQKKGVRVSLSADLRGFYRMMQTTAKRDGFALHDFSYYQRVFQIFEPVSYTHLTLPTIFYV